KARRLRSCGHGPIAARVGRNRQHAGFRRRREDREGLAATLILRPAAGMWKASASVIAALAAAVAGQAYAEAPEPAPTAQICDRAPGAWDDTAQANAISLYALEWVPFGPS